MSLRVAAQKRYQKMNCRYIPCKSLSRFSIIFQRQLFVTQWPSKRRVGGREKLGLFSHVERDDSDDNQVSAFPVFAPQQSLIRKSHNPSHSSLVACAHTTSTSSSFSFTQQQLNSYVIGDFCWQEQRSRALFQMRGRRRKAIRQLSMMTID